MRTLAILTLSAALAASATAQDARPAGTMKTRWAAELNPDSPLPEHPRPSLERQAWTNLNGRWDYAITAKDAAKPDRWEGKIVVPFCAESQLSGVQRHVGPDRQLWYRRSITRPQTRPGERALLHFGAVDWQATVWLNGRELGRHQGGYDPFTLDVTDTLRDGPNELVVAVWDPTDAGPQPRGKQVRNPEGIWYTAVTGIWQTVWLEVVPATHAATVRFETDAAAQDGAQQVLCHLRLNAPFKGTLRVAWKSPAGAAGETTAAVDGPACTAAIQLAKPERWSPASPTLYQATVSLLAGDQVVDSFATYFACRTVGWGKDKHGTNRLLLNGEPLFHYGPLDQGWWPDGLYTAPTDAALRSDIEVTRAMGFNMARKHVKVEPERWYFWADKLGLMVWQDMPSGFATGRRQGQPATDDANFRRELAAVIEARRFHPSIVAWIPYNEGWGQPDAAGTNQTLQATKQHDPARLVGAASGWTDHGWGDWKDMHNYPGPGMFPPMDDRVSVLGEFGGLGLPLAGHLWWDKRNWGYRTYQAKDELHRNYAVLMAKLADLVPRGLAAAVYTQTTDCEGEVNGLLTYDRVPKFDPAWLTQHHAPLYQPPAAIRTTTIAPTAETAPGPQWAFTLDQPADGWERPGFDDSDWRRGAAGFGTEGTPGARVGTRWDRPAIWLRRTFRLDAKPAGRLMLRIHHDEDATVFLNGTKIATLEGYVGDYFALPLDDAARAALRTGDNVLAIHCRQSQGGQFIDAGLVDETRVE